MAGEILAYAAFQEKKNVSLSSGYGSQVRGGITHSDLVMADGFIDFPMVTHIDFLITMLQEAYQDSLPLVKGDGKIVLDSALVKSLPDSLVKCYGIPATDIAVRELKNEMAANIILLAAAASIGHLVAKDALEESIRRTVSRGFVDIAPAKTAGPENERPAQSGEQKGRRRVSMFRARTRGGCFSIRRPLERLSRFSGTLSRGMRWL
jgi:2-oxoglutarate ferredoxin oxidoreductase subunit gamma